MGRRRESTIDYIMGETSRMLAMCQDVLFSNKTDKYNKAGFLLTDNSAIYLHCNELTGFKVGFIEKPDCNPALAFIPHLQKTLAVVVALQPTTGGKTCGGVREGMILVKHFCSNKSFCMVVKYYGHKTATKTEIVANLATRICWGYYLI